MVVDACTCSTEINLAEYTQTRNEEMKKLSLSIFRHCYKNKKYNKLLYTYVVHSSSIRTERPVPLAFLWTDVFQSVTFWILLSMLCKIIRLYPQNIVSLQHTHSILLVQHCVREGKRGFWSNNNYNIISMCKCLVSIITWVHSRFHFLLFLCQAV